MRAPLANRAYSPAEAAPAVKSRSPRNRMNYYCDAFLSGNVQRKTVSSPLPARKTQPVGHASAGPPASRFVRVYDPDVAVGPNPELTETKREQHRNTVRPPNRPQRKGMDTCG